MFDIPVGTVSGGLAGVAFLVLGLILLVSWRREFVGSLLLVACAGASAWAFAGAYDAWTGGAISRAFGIVEVVRTVAWLAFLWAVLPLNGERPGVAAFLTPGPILAAALALVTVACHLIPGGVSLGLLDGQRLALGIFGHLLLAILGLALVENLFRNTPKDLRWQIKFLCFALGGVMAYDFFIYSEALLFARVNAALVDARGIVNAVVVPLIAVSAARNPQWSLDVFVSRRVVFHTSALILAGAYCLLMAAAGFYLREFGGSWGPLLQIVFIFAALTLLILVLFSGRFRAWLKITVNKHFFNYKYDYREEWQRFIGTLASTDGNETLRVRVIQAVADVFESPEGAIWLFREPDRFVPAASWNMPQSEDVAVIEPGLARYLEWTPEPILLEAGKEAVERERAVRMPDWLFAQPRAWMLLPLVHHERLLGVLLLGRPRAPKTLNWEDFDLLRLIASQAASYLTEMETARALTEARQFEAFNRRFAFVMHDIKNLASQLSLMVQNADTHIHNPEFREDMLETIKESVHKMNQLLVRLHQKGTESKKATSVDLVSLLEKLVADKESVRPAPTFLCEERSVIVLAEEDRVQAVFAHLIQNAVDATDPDGRVEVRLFCETDAAVVEIEDTGHGMDAAFIRDRLFAPFDSTKKGGYGIGVYESREYVRELDGRFDVISAPGEGTNMRITLPVLVGGVGAPSRAAPVQGMAARVG